jgi:hypothetical protein
MKQFGLVVFVAILALAVAFPARASLISISPSKDNTLYQDDIGETSNGSGYYLFAGSTAFGELRRTVMAFDIASEIPAGSTINSVSLTMNMSRCGPTCGTAVPMELHALLADWGEGASFAGGQEGIPAQAEQFDATWLYTFYPDSSWANPGGDFSSVVSGTQIVSSLGLYAWASNSQLIADVQSWLDNPATNFGWMLKGGEDAPTTAKRFDSRENLAGTGPLLTIDYTAVPEPSTILFVAAGLLGFIRFRRRPN